MRPRKKQQLARYRSAERRKTSLAQADPTGRLDVMLYRLAGRGLERLERQHNLAGLRENFLPILERFITRHVPAENFMTRELEAFFEVARENAGRLNAR